MRSKQIKTMCLKYRNDNRNLFTEVNIMRRCEGEESSKFGELQTKPS